MAFKETIVVKISLTGLSTDASGSSEFELELYGDYTESRTAINQAISAAAEKAMTDLDPYLDGYIFERMLGQRDQS